MVVTIQRGNIGEVFGIGQNQFETSRQTCCLPCNCNHDFLAPDILSKCGRAVLPEGFALQRTLPTDCGGTPSFDGPRQLSPVIKRWPPIRDLWTALRRLGSPLTNY